MKIKIAALCVLLSASGLNAFAQTGQGDPPGRIARLNYMAGTVTTEPAGASDWSYAQINRPLTTGDQLWNDENARSELHIGSTAVRLGSSTALSVLALDDDTVQLKIAQGTLSTRVRELPPGTTYEIDTPNTALAITTPGEMRVDVAPDGRATTVTVRSGGVTAYGDGGSVQLAGGQQMTFEGTNLQQASANAAPAPDAFDEWAAGRDASEDRSISARYVSRDVPGYQDLDANGTWRNDPSYGPVWTPTAVSADWAPYRQGHWAWQDPWGWTWIDDAPWGFAPYHYGRWAYIGSRWAWVPGPMDVSAPPAYSPALVGFVGDGDGGPDWNVAVTVGGIAAAGVAWFPLGPGEAWRPHRDGWSPRYFERVNRNVYVRNTYVNYHAPRGLTAVPTNLFVLGQPVGRQPYAVDPSRWRHPRFFAGAPGIAPTRDSFAPGGRRASYQPPQAGFDDRWSRHARPSRRRLFMTGTCSRIAIRAAGTARATNRCISSRRMDRRGRSSRGRVAGAGSRSACAAAWLRRCASAAGCAIRRERSALRAWGFIARTCRFARAARAAAGVSTDVAASTRKRCAARRSTHADAFDAAAAQSRVAGGVSPGAGRTAAP